MVLIKRGIKGIYSGVPVFYRQGPCATGYHVPTKKEFDNLFSAGYSMGVWSSSSMVNFSTYLNLPMAGNLEYNDGALAYDGTGGYYHTSTPGNNNYSYYFSFGEGSKTSSSSYKTYGDSIRPFKDEPVVPDSGWTTVYQGTGDAGIFHNTSLGLISISSDGTTWYTIADKNLGATVVYNYGDALSESNCGKFYQRGNNYGFPHTGATSTSSSTVDASGYGYGNYYSNSTFILGTVWDSSHNKDLRGGGNYRVAKFVAIGNMKVWPTVEFMPGANTIAYYPLNGDANDYSGNNRNLTTNGVTYTETIANGHKVGTFTGTIEGNGSKGGEWTTGISMSNANMTLSVRAKTTGNGTSSTYGANKWILLHFQDSGRSYGQCIKTAHLTTGYRAGEWGAGSSDLGTSPDTPTPYADGQWHHICATYTMSSVKLFVDGQLVSSGTGSITAQTATYGFYVGKDTTSYNHYGYAGQMSEVIYEKATWTDEAVLAYYNGTKGNYGL